MTVDFYNNTRQRTDTSLQLVMTVDFYNNTKQTTDTSLQPVMTVDFYNNTVPCCGVAALNISWAINATALPELEDWSTASSGSRRRHHQHLVMAWWQQLGWSALFAPMLVIATGGNAIVLWIVLGELSFCLSSSLLSVLYYLYFLLVIPFSFSPIYFLSCVIPVCSYSSVDPNI
jgi:hypothetical protein